MTNRDGFRGLNDPAGARSPYVNQKGPQPNGGTGVVAAQSPTVLVNDPDFTLHVGDVLQVLRELPDESVHCVVTSPPYWGLRDYGTGTWAGGNPGCDHATTADMDRTNRTLKNAVRDDAAGQYAHPSGWEGGGRVADLAHLRRCKCGATRTDQQLGLEATPDLFVARMVDVFREVRRVLRADGTCWVNLGDSYVSQGGNRDGYVSNTGQGARREAEPQGSRRMTSGLRGGDAPASAPGYLAAPGLKAKDLVGIPWRVAFALQADGWYLRSDIIWAKPNPMPESVTDRPTKAHEYVFLLTKSARYFFDQEAVREAHKSDYDQIAGWYGGKGAHSNGAGYSGNPRVVGEKGHALPANPAGRNVRSVWEIATQPYPEAHFATFPEALPERCIRAGTSERGCCPECGAAWERIVETNNPSKHAADPENTLGWANTHSKTSNAQSSKSLHRQPGGVYSTAVFKGWRPTCAHHLEPVPCTILDPFMGSGTVALVARRLGRRSIGIELNPDYANLCARRLQQLSLFAGGDAYLGESLGWPAPDGPPAKEPA